MPYAKTYEEARDVAIAAHVCHFGREIAYEVAQDNNLLPLRTAFPGSMEENLRELTYTMPFELRPTGVKPQLQAVDKFVKPTLSPRTETSMTFTVWIPYGHPSGHDPPIPCTEFDCPVNNGPKKRFHYKGLYLANADWHKPSKTFGNSVPPSEVLGARLRLERGNPQEGDGDLSVRELSDRELKNREPLDQELWDQGLRNEELRNQKVRDQKLVIAFHDYHKV